MKRPTWGDVPHEFLDVAPLADCCVLCGQPEQHELHVSVVSETLKA